MTEWSYFFVLSISGDEMVTADEEEEDLRDGKEVPKIRRGRQKADDDRLKELNMNRTVEVLYLALLYGDEMGIHLFDIKR